MSKQLCPEIHEECGYINFTNDVCNLMNKYNIQGVSELEKMIKAADEGIFNAEGKYIDVALYSGRFGWFLYDVDDFQKEHYYLKDYGKTWFFTKEAAEGAKLS